MVTREQVRQTLRQWRIAEAVAIAFAVVLGAAVLWAMRAEHVGDPLPEIVVAVIAAGFGAAVVGAVLLAAIAVATRVVADRIDAAGGLAAENARGIDELRRMANQQAEVLRGILVELGRLRTADPAQAEALADRILSEVEGGQRLIYVELERMRAIERQRVETHGELADMIHEQAKAVGDLAGIVTGLVDSVDRMRQDERAELARMRSAERDRDVQLTTMQGAIQALAAEVEKLRTTGLDPESLEAARSISRRLRDR